MFIFSLIIFYIIIAYFQYISISKKSIFIESMTELKKDRKVDILAINGKNSNMESK